MTGAQRIERLRDALRSVLSYLTYECSWMDCDRHGTWASSLYTYYCDEHVDDARASDRKARSKGCRGDEFREVEHAAKIRELLRVLEE